MKRINYPERGSAEFVKLQNAYKALYTPEELNKMQTAWDKWKKTYKVTTINETVEQLLVADIGVLADVFERFRASKIRMKKKGAKGRYVKTTAREELDNIFKYTSKYDKRIAGFFNAHADELGIGTCNYCQLAYVNSYSVIKEGSQERHQHFDIDHYLPKGECPILALSLFNFVPSCQVCNSRIKSGKVIGRRKTEWIKLSPVYEQYDFDKNVKICLRMHRKASTAFRKKGEYYIHFNCKNGFRTFVDFFHLEERYEFHKLEAIRIEKLKSRYPLSARKKLATLLGTSESRVREDLFHEHYLKQNDRCFAKLTKDMLGRL